MAASGGVLVVVLASLLAHTNIGKKYQKTCHIFKRNVGLYLLTNKEPLHTKRSQTSLKVSNLSMTLDAVRVLSFFFRSGMHRPGPSKGLSHFSPKRSVFWWFFRGTNFTPKRRIQDDCFFQSKKLKPQRAGQNSKSIQVAVPHPSLALRDCEK